LLHQKVQLQEEEVEEEEVQLMQLCHSHFLLLGGIHSSFLTCICTSAVISVCLYVPFSGNVVGMPYGAGGDPPESPWHLSACGSNDIPHKFVSRIIIVSQHGYWSNPAHYIYLEPTY
jgi:hypothetical protein